METAQDSSTVFPAGSRPRVVVLGPGDHERVLSEAERLRRTIESYADIACWDLGFGEDLTAIDADLAIVLGGDGSILRAANQMGYRQLPVIGINLGRLGFLADLSPDEFALRLPTIIAGEFRVIRHLMYEMELFRGEQRIAQRLGLNEVSVLAGAPFSMLEVHLYVDAELVTTYSCDGLIIATPVGSTAHSLSAGGPILRKDLQAFVISPISPHTLTNRPVVDAADRVFEMVVTRPNEGTAIVADGNLIQHLQPGDRVRVKRAIPQFQSLEVAGNGYYRTLREKLGWGGRLRLNDN